jgi:hypothetical protein
MSERTRKRVSMNGKCEGCGETSWLLPLYGERGGPLRCFMCAGEWNAKYTRRRKWGRIAIKAMKGFQHEGGRYDDLDKLKLHAGVGGFGGLVSRISPGYEQEDNLGAELGDITSELLADVLQLVHPDKHPPERRELAKRVTQELLALKPFVFPAPKPKPVSEVSPPAHQTVAHKSEKQPEAYPCELCADQTPYHYCDPCKAEWEKRQREEHERERAKHRKWYARRKAERDRRALDDQQLAAELGFGAPKPTVRKPRNLRQSSVAVNQTPGSNLINHSLSGLQAAILVAAITKRVSGARGCDVSQPELLAEIWGWKTWHKLRWTEEDVKPWAKEGRYRVGDTRASSDTHGAFDHIPRGVRQSARASLSRALTRLDKRMLISFVNGNGIYSGGLVLTPHGEQIARQLLASRVAAKRNVFAVTESGLAAWGNEAEIAA